MTTYACRVESRFTVPSSTTVSATNSGGGPSSVSLIAADYYLTAAGGVSGLIANFQTRLNADRDPSPGAWSVSMSTTTGLVTIDCASGNTLQKTGGVNATYDAGIASTETFAGDGYVECVAETSALERFFGLSQTDTNVNYTSIQFAIHFDNGNLRIWESGSDKGNQGTYVTDDVIRIRRIGTAIYYQKNGTTFYTSLSTSSAALRIDTSFYHSSARLRCVRMYDNGTHITPLAWSGTNVTASTDTWSLAWTSTDLRDLLGFTADISGVQSAQTGTQQARGVWFPDCPLSIDGDPAQAPKVTDKRSTISPTGTQFSLVGNSYRRHRGVMWTHVPRASTWESAATYTNASYETFANDCFYGLGHAWFTPSSPVQIYWNDAGTDRAVGYTYNSSAGMAGWYVVNVDSTEPRPSVDGWTGLFRIEFGDIVGVGA